ncbi:MAG: ABC transporter permease [Firmicutes bacterium]|nr:ABC transporter permease [Bacillota bacterium]MBR0521801.1 ABC transporter permease [Bacillota bacterium]
MAKKQQQPKLDANGERKQRSQFGEAWHRMKKDKGAMLGLAVVSILVLVAILSNFLLDYDTDVVGMNTKERLQAPNAKHLLGTDEYGRDILFRILYGSRYSLSVGLVAVAIALVAGVTLGAIAGYKGGAVEEVIMRLTDIFSSVPNMLMALVVVSALGQSMLNLMIAIGVTSIPQFVRITRATVLTVRNQEYVESARAIGLSTPQIIISHILPNSLSPIIVQTTLRVASAIISASSLSFLGLGIPAPNPEWGSMLSGGRKFIRDYPYMTLYPGLAIMITVLSLNLLGDGLRDALDPKLKN